MIVQDSIIKASHSNVGGFFLAIKAQERFADCFFARSQYNCTASEQRKQPLALLSQENMFFYEKSAVKGRGGSIDEARRASSQRRAEGSPL